MFAPSPVGNGVDQVGTVGQVGGKVELLLTSSVTSWEERAACFPASAHSAHFHATLCRIDANMALASSENHERTFHKQKILGSAQVRERGKSE